MAPAFADRGARDLGTRPGASSYRPDRHPRNVRHDLELLPYPMDRLAGSA